MSGIRMRQICLVARRLEPVVEQLQSVLELPVCHRDPGVGKYGLENALFPVGDGFLEVVAPVREGTTAGRYLERRGGDGGYMVILQCDDLDAARERVKSEGVRIVDQFDGDVRLALAGYYQGARAVRERGLFDDTQQYVSVIQKLYGSV